LLQELARLNAHSEGDPMSQDRTHEGPEIRDVFDVSNTEPLEPGDVDLSDITDEQWQSDAGILAPSPAAETSNAGGPSAGWQIDGESALSVGQPSRPLLGRLPLARAIPQDVHSAMDYLDAGGVIAGAFLTTCPKAKAASWLMGGSGILASSLTDYKLSLAKLIPIEAHEAIDYGFGLSAIAAPFVLGYRKTAPHVAAMHVAIGIGTIVASLFTDYRAYRGVGRRAA
jgi:hypothetical protein